jgi:hypothetical protein
MNKRRCPRIFFTGLVVTSEQKRAIKRLGGVLVQEEKVFEELLNGRLTHLVTDKVKRTLKFLCALGKVEHIVTVEWISDSQRECYFLPEDNYMPSDEETMQKFGITLSEIMRRRKLLSSQNQQVFSGKKFFVTPSVKPSHTDMKYIIECNGGTILNSLNNVKASLATTESLKDIIIVTCKKDSEYCKSKLMPLFVKKLGGEEKDYFKYFYIDELVLTSTMRQELNCSEHHFQFS